MGNKNQAKCPGLTFIAYKFSANHTLHNLKVQQRLLHQQSQRLHIKHLVMFKEISSLFKH